MWEVTLIGKPKDILLFFELKNTLKSQYCDDILVVITYAENLIISIALKEKKNIRPVKKEIYQTIIKIVKLEYYSEKLRAFENEKSLNTYLIGNLSMFGLMEEVDYAMHSTKLTNCVNIRSFVNFKCQNIVNMWKKDIIYFNRYFSETIGNEKYIDYLKILASTTKNKMDTLYLVSENNEMFLIDSDRKRLKTLSISDEVDIISSLLILSPKKIIINCTETLSEKVTNIISYIFEDRVSVLL